MKPDEKRKHKRFESLLLLDYQSIDLSGYEGEYAMGRSLDLSASGIRLETYREIPADTSLVITLAVENDLVNILGRHVHSLQADSWYVSGVEFYAISGEDRTVLGRYIDELRGRRAKLPEDGHSHLPADNL